jgi:hypothetical protein
MIHFGGEVWETRQRFDLRCDRTVCAFCVVRGCAPDLDLDLDPDLDLDLDLDLDRTPKSGESGYRR